MTIEIGFLTAIVAAAGAVIAYLQFVTARRKLMLDLFDRRLRVVETLYRALGPFQTTAKITDENFVDLLSARAGARFLFGEDVQDHLNTLQSEVTFYIAHADDFFDDMTLPRRDILFQKKTEIEKRLFDYPAKLAEVFGPYMKFAEKQTKPWLPW